MQQDEARFPFHDLHSFKDYVVFAQTCLATGRFPRREGTAINAQWTPELAFQGLRYGLELAAAEGVSAKVVAECRGLFEDADQHFRANNVREGFFALERADEILKRIPTQ